MAERTWLWCKRRPALVGLSLLFLVFSVAGTLAGTLFALERKMQPRPQDSSPNWKMPTSQVPDIVEKLNGYRRRADPMLKRELQ